MNKIILFALVFLIACSNKDKVNNEPSHVKSDEQTNENKNDTINSSDEKVENNEPIVTLWDDVHEVYTLIGNREYHGDELPYEPGKHEAWALIGSENNFSIEKIQFEVTMVHDAVIDGENEKSGKRVEALTDKPVFLMFDQNMPFENTQGISGTIHSFGEMEHLSPKIFENGDILIYEGDKVDYYYENFKLIFDHQDTQTVILSDAASEYPGEILMWSGDINKDGIKDLILEISDHYNVSHPSLWMSTSSGNLKKVAEIRTTGC